VYLSNVFRRQAEVSNLEVFTEPEISQISQVMATESNDVQQNIYNFSSSGY
jgi:DNA replication protein DnaD